MGVPVSAQSGEGSGVVGVPPVGVGGGLEAGEVVGAAGSGVDGFVGVEAVSGSPPLDGPLDEGLGRLDVSGAGAPVSGQGGGVVPPVAAVFDGGFVEAPVAVVPVVGPAPEGFGGLAMCAGGFVCGSAPQFLPGPTGLSCSVTASVIVFSWNAVSGADDYTAKLQLAVPGSPQTTRTTSGRSVVFSGLSSSTAYYIGVHSNVGGVAQYFSGVYCTTAVGPPSCGAVSGSGVQLYWKSDSRVHRWFVGRATSGGGHTDGRALAGSALSTVFTGLEANVSYTFYFWWRASAGGAWNQVFPSRVCTTTAPPAAPVVSCTTTASSVSVSWGSVRGAVRYRVSRGYGWAAASGRSHVFSNLAGSTSYSVRVQGWNSAGWGQTGTRVCTTKAATLPAPAGLACEADSTQIRFSWDEVAGADGYSAKIQMAQAGSAQTEVATGSTSVTFTGLAASTRYWVSVLAVKNNKAQDFAGVNCATLADIDAPVLSCKATSGTVTVSWEEVAGATRYRARAGGAAWTGDIAATTHTFTGLAPATMFTVTVQSGGFGGWGNAAEVRCVTAAAGVYCDDTTSNSVVLEWDQNNKAEYWYAAISTGGGYTGGRTHGRAVTEGNSTEFKGLDKATRYVILLWWNDGDGWHTISPPPECWTKHLDTPEITGHTTGGNTLTIEWEPVEGAQRYQVKISPAGTAGQNSASGRSSDPGAGVWETVISTGAFHTFTGLTAGTGYTVRLRAVDAQGNPSAGAQADRETSKVECQAVTASSITLEWDDPEGEYQWRVSGSKQGSDSSFQVKILAAGAGTETTFGSLDADTGYSFAVDRRMGIVGEWEKQEPTTHCLTSPASPVLDDCPQAADTDGTIRWTPNGADHYRITLDHTQTDIEWTVTNSTAHTFTDLEEGKIYEVAVQARNPQGWSQNSTCEDNKDKKKMKTLPAIDDNLITGTGDYYFTEGTLKGVLYAAESAINTYVTAPRNTWNSCKNTIDKTKLAAAMLSILPGEASSADSSSLAPSPMVLSRGDNFAIKEQFRTNKNGVEANLNLRTYSHIEKTGYARAHWSPGVGPWQLDSLGPDVNLNHAERADITKGGVEVAKFLLRSHCSDTTDDDGLRSVLKGRWNGCRSQKDICYNRYIKDNEETGNDRIYKSGKLNIEIVKEYGGVALGQVDGGIHERICRWTSDEVSMPCYVYDTGKPQGFVIDGSPDGGKGSNPYTPYPSAFISLTDPVTETKYAVWPSNWPKSSDLMSWPTEIVTSSFAIYRAVKPGEFVRCSPGYNPIENEGDDRGTCHGETYAPFGTETVITPKTGDSNVEGWFNGSVPYREGNTEADNHKLQVQSCETILARILSIQFTYIFCWWEDI